MLPDQFYEAMQRIKPFFAQITDAQLKDYGESANAGCWVSFRLPDTESLEIYRGQDRSGRNARTGRRYKLLVIEIDDDETIVLPKGANMEQQEKPARKLSQISGALCHDAEFRQWIASEYGETCADDKEAAEFIRQMCGIQSRSLLDTEQVAAETFRGILLDFETHKQALAASLNPPG